MTTDTCQWEWLDQGNYATECGRRANSITMAGADEADLDPNECFFCGREIEYEEMVA